MLYVVQGVCKPEGCANHCKGDMMSVSSKGHSYSLTHYFSALAMQSNCPAIEVAQLVVLDTSCWKVLDRPVDKLKPHNTDTTTA